jgi:hypothetical protein
MASAEWAWAMPNTIVIKATNNINLRFFFISSPLFRISFLQMNFVHLVAKYSFTGNAGCSENFSSFFRFIRLCVMFRQKITQQTSHAAVLVQGVTATYRFNLNAVANRQFYQLFF